MHSPRKFLGGGGGARREDETLVSCRVTWPWTQTVKCYHVNESSTADKNCCAWCAHVTGNFEGVGNLHEPNDAQKDVAMFYKVADRGWSLPGRLIG
jgi:hypothetical protein